MPRLVRRAPLSERIKAFCSIWDHLLWLSEELNSYESDQLLAWTGPACVVLNLLFMVARANTGRNWSASVDDVFSDYKEPRLYGAFSWMVSPQVRDHHVG